MPDIYKYELPAAHRGTVLSIAALGQILHVTDDYIDWKGHLVFACIVESPSAAEASIMIISPASVGVLL
ncbi:hypothetical protein [Ensifer sp. OV372]|uniref:hypothetical protein n=1 Tax=Ensifer sp. OV372 TaxID=1855293 RepID=UPI000B847CAE|nr:hypothetical protein [Ensifer sp. OV372]